MMDSHTFYVDAETDGLYGRFLSVAALVEDADCNELDHFYVSVKTDPGEIRSEWVAENVLPFLGAADHVVETEAELLDRFWAFWLKHRENSICVAYVQYPVEARLFQACVAKDIPGREQLAPFPLYDLSTLMIVRGLHFDSDIQALSGLPLQSHDAMNDVRMMAAVWKKLFF